MEKTISLARLAKNVERVAREIESAGTVYRIRRPGGKSIVVMDQGHLDAELEWAAFFAAHPNWRAEIETAERELRDGRTVPLDAVLTSLRSPRMTEASARGESRASSGRRARPRRTPGRRARANR
jgi:hypothetical protein